MSLKHACTRCMKENNCLDPPRARQLCLVMPGRRYEMHAGAEAAGSSNPHSIITWRGSHIQPNSTNSLHPMRTWRGSPIQPFWQARPNGNETNPTKPIRAEPSRVDRPYPTGPGRAELTKPNRSGLTIPTDHNEPNRRDPSQPDKPDRPGRPELNCTKSTRAEPKRTDPPTRPTPSEPHRAAPTEPHPTGSD